MEKIRFAITCEIEVSENVIKRMKDEGTDDVLSEYSQEMFDHIDKLGAEMISVKTYLKSQC